ncbi:MAG: transglycosylase SLT domain-containing protein [Bacteroidota bacterium]
MNTNMPHVKFHAIVCAGWIILWLAGCQNAESGQTPLAPIVSPTVAEADSIQKESPFLPFNQYDQEIQEIAEIHTIDWMLIKAVIIKESHFNEQFISTAGAVGLMQLMPRERSFVSQAYRNYVQSRRQKRNSLGERIYQGRKDTEWAADYVKELEAFRTQYQEDHPALYEIDARFNPTWNLNSGVNQLASDYRYFRSRGHGPYASRIYALAAYNAGRGAVVKDKANRYLDRIPVNRQTELYVGYIERIYVELVKEKGLITKSNEWILKI